MRFGFSTSDRWVSRLIRWATRSRVSHSYMVWEHSGTELTLEATTWRVKVRHYETFKAKARVVSEYMLLEDNGVNGERGLKAVLPFLDRRYDMLGAIGQAWVLLGRLFGRAWKNPWADPDGFWCSELVAVFLQAAGVPGADELDPERTVAEDIRLFAADSNRCQAVTTPQRVPWHKRWFRRRKTRSKGEVKE